MHPVIREMQAAGKTTYRALADALNDRGVSTARGRLVGPVNGPQYRAARSGAMMQAEVDSPIGGSLGPSRYATRGERSFGPKEP
jgi:hypothetical protein